MRLFVVIALAAGTLVLSAASVPAASNGFRPAGIVPHAAGNLLTPATITAPPSGGVTCGSITCDAYEAGVNGYFADVAAASGAADNVYSTATQYYDHTGKIAYKEAFGGAYVDTHAYPASGCPAKGNGTCLTEAQLVTEMKSDLAANGWAASGTNLFVILLPDGVDTCFSSNAQNGCASNAFCAYHDSNGSLLYAVQPFAAGLGCTGKTGQGFPNGNEIDEAVNTLSHEQMEAITDPNPSANAWYANGGGEIGDLCAWGFGDPLGTTAGGQPYNQVINGHDYSLQLEYSNAANSKAGGCVSHLGGPASGITNGGTGPLTYHGGRVMRTNTVRTIYWFPSLVPAISTLPVVTGTAAVGHQLSTTDGAWTNSPTSYAYAWERCNSSGSSCVTIANATSSTYTLTAADAGHDIHSQVLATNATGDAGGYASSAAVLVVAGKPIVITRPKLSGIATVGKSLYVSNGRWKNTPTRFTRHWLRCSASGGSCVVIAAATRSSYVLKPADFGHTLKVRITAQNAAGSTSALTARSAPVGT